MLTKGCFGAILTKQPFQRCTMQFDLRKFITAGTRPYHAEFQCDLSAYDYAGARISQPVTAVFDAQTDGDEVQITLRAKASVHGECARCLDPVTREETVDTDAGRRHHHGSAAEFAARDRRSGAHHLRPTPQSPPAHLPRRLTTKTTTKGTGTFVVVLPSLIGF